MGDRTAVLEATLHEMRVLIKHWEADRQCNLTPTERSLHDATETIDRVLAGGEPSVVGLCFLAGADSRARCAVVDQPTSRLAAAE